MTAMPIAIGGSMNANDAGTHATRRLGSKAATIRRPTGMATAIDAERRHEPAQSAGAPGRARPR